MINCGHGGFGMMGTSRYLAEGSNYNKSLKLRMVNQTSTQGQHRQHVTFQIYSYEDANKQKYCSCLKDSEKAQFDLPATLGFHIIKKAKFRGRLVSLFAVMKMFKCYNFNKNGLKVLLIK